MNERSRTKVHAKVDKSFEASVPINISRLLSDTVQLKHHKNFSESLVSPDNGKNWNIMFIDVPKLYLPFVSGKNIFLPVR